MIDFEELWCQQEAFMHLLQRERGFTKFPVDLTSKQGQRALREATHHCVDELVEAGFLLKNHKAHRKTEIKDFDRDAYLEELCDAFHLFLEICIEAGFSPEEVTAKYLEKGKVNEQRILSGY